ncbi:MAG: c-type cytochrome [Steroidobacteraceae bacterium]
MNRVSKFGLAALCSVAAISVGMAQSKPSEQQAQNAVKVRKALFDVQNFAFSPVMAMLKRQEPFNAQDVVTAAKRVEMTASIIPEVFKVDTRNSSVSTKARDGIWTNMADFKQKAANLETAAQNLQQAAMSGDQGATMRAAGMTGKACGSCHDEFRNK